MPCWWHRTRRRRISMEGKMTECYRSAAAIVLLLMISFEPAECDIHYVTWNPQGVKTYNLTNPLQVKLNDKVVLRCDNGDFAFSNAVVQPHQSQYEQCNCMTSDLVSCGDEYTYGYCAVGLSNIVVTISQQSATLGAVFNFRPGEIIYLISYANNATTAGDAQNQVYMGGDCTKGLKLPVMVAPLPPKQPLTTPTPTSYGMGVSGHVGASGSSKDSPWTPTSSPTATFADGDKNTSTKKQLVGNIDEVVQTEPSQNKKKLEDWHLAAIGVLVGVLVLSVVVFLLVVGVLCVRRPTARVVPGDIPDDNTSGEKDKSGTIVRNVGAVPSSPTSTTYPEGLFNDPLDN